MMGLRPHQGLRQEWDLARGALLLVTWFGFALRLFRLEAQSLWYDEALSLHYASASLPNLLTLVFQDNHPPLYFLFLGFWVSLTGSSEYALRFFSVLPGVLTLPLLWALARRLFSPSRYRNLGIPAALLLAVSPLHLTYSQEARMYTWATLLGLGMVLAFGRAFAAGQERRRWWVLYALFTVLGALTHYYVLFITGALVLFSGLSWLGRGLRGPRPRLRFWQEATPWGLAHAGIGLALGPLLPAVLRRAQEDATAWPGSIGLGVMLQRLVQDFSLGRGGASFLGEGLALAALAGLGLLSLGIALRRQRYAPSALLLCLLLVPPLILYAIISQRPKFDSRYLLPELPLFLLALAAGTMMPAALVQGGRYSLIIKSLGWGITLLLLLTVLALQGRAWAKASSDPRFLHPDFRAVVRYIEKKATPEEAVVLVGGHGAVAYRYYQQRPLSLYPLPDRLVPDLSRPLDREVASVLNEIARWHPSLWLLLWQEELADPRNLVFAQLNQRAQPINVGEPFAGLTLLRFALPPDIAFSLEPPIPSPLQATLGESIELRGFQLEQTSLRAGETLTLILYWRALQPVSGEVWAFVHLLNARNRVYAQVDKRPPNDFFPPSRWPVGQTIADPYELLVPPGTPPGPYILEAGLYRQPGMTRLPVAETGEERVILGPVEIQRGPWQQENLRIQEPQEIAFGPVRLLGYELERTEYRPGEELPLRLFWVLQATTLEEIRVAVRLVGPQGPLATQEVPPLEGAYPLAQWQAGELVREVVVLSVPREAKAGRYRLEVGLRHQEGTAFSPNPWWPLGREIILR